MKLPKVGLLNPAHSALLLGLRGALFHPLTDHLRVMAGKFRRFYHYHQSV